MWWTKHNCHSEDKNINLLKDKEKNAPKWYNNYETRERRKQGGKMKGELKMSKKMVTYETRSGRTWEKRRGEKSDILKVVIRKLEKWATKAKEKAWWVCRSENNYIKYLESICGDYFESIKSFIIPSIGNKLNGVDYTNIL